jgi:hypothetical protein
MVQTNEMRAPATMVILPCPACGRAVKVLGRVRRVLCACGQVLMETRAETAPAAATPAEALKTG